MLQLTQQTSRHRSLAVMVSGVIVRTARLARGSSRRAQGAGGVARTGGGGFSTTHSVARSLGLKASFPRGMEVRHG